jgi:pimeloyl-ACP methyl ester carboxylesterase
VALHVVTGTSLAVDRLMLVGATGGIDDEAARARRREADERTAADLEATGDVDDFLARWVSGPMFAELADAADLGERRRNRAAGLASSLRLTGTGTQQPLWDRFHSLAVPVLALAGADDARFATHALRIARAVPHGTAALVPGGGHAVHLAQPAATGRLVEHWLAALTKDAEEGHPPREGGRRPAAADRSPPASG